MQAAKDAEEGQRTSISIREATTVARSQNGVAVSKEVSVSGTSRTGEAAGKLLAVSVVTRLIANRVPATTAASLVSFTGEAASDFPSAPLTGRPLNFGVVVPGVYRSSYPKPDDYTYIRDLKLKTIVLVSLNCLVGLSANSRIERWRRRTKQILILRAL